MAVSALKGGGLLVRVDAGRNDELLSRPGAAQAEMGTARTMGPRLDRDCGRCHQRRQAAGSLGRHRDGIQPHAHRVRRAAGSDRARLRRDGTVTSPCPAAARPLLVELVETPVPERETGAGRVHSTLVAAADLLSDLAELDKTLTSIETVLDPRPRSSRSMSCRSRRPPRTCGTTRKTPSGSPLGCPRCRPRSIGWRRCASGWTTWQC